MLPSGLHEIIEFFNGNYSFSGQVFDVFSVSLFSLDRFRPILNRLNGLILRLSTSK